MEQVTCIADDVFALTGLFALLASVLLTKTVRPEAPSEQQEEGLCQGGTAAGTGTGMLTLTQALPGDLPQSNILANIRTQPPCISSHIYFRGIFY